MTLTSAFASKARSSIREAVTTTSPSSASAAAAELERPAKIRRFIDINIKYLNIDFPLAVFSVSLILSQLLRERLK